MQEAGIIMSLLKMRLIVLIDRYKQITAVAKALQLKQPTVSFHMKKMEEELGVKLFEARTGKILLTNNGKLLLHYAYQIDVLYAEAMTKLSTISEFGQQRFVIGCTNSVAAWLLRTDALGKLNSIENMDISIVIHEEESLFQKNLLGTVDLVLCGEISNEFESGALQNVKVLSSALKLIVPANHSLASTGLDHSSMLEDYVFAELLERSITDCVNQWNRKENHYRKVTNSYSSVDLLLSAVKNQSSLAILPEYAIPITDEIVGIDLPGDVPEWHLFASWRRSYWDHSLVQQVLDIMKGLE